MPTKHRTSARVDFDQLKWSHDIASFERCRSRLREIDACSCSQAAKEHISSYWKHLALEIQKRWPQHLGKEVIP